MSPFTILGRCPRLAPAGCLQDTSSLRAPGGLLYRTASAVALTLSLTMPLLRRGRHCRRGSRPRLPPSRSSRGRPFVLLAAGGFGAGSVAAARGGFAAGVGGHRLPRVCRRPQAPAGVLNEREMELGGCDGEKRRLIHRTPNC